MTYHARLTDDDMIQMPAEVRDALGLAPGDMVVIERDGDKVVVKSHKQFLNDIQTRFRAMVGDDYSVDQFLAERAQEWGD